MIFIKHISYIFFEFEFRRTNAIYTSTMRRSVQNIDVSIVKKFDFPDKNFWLSRLSMRKLNENKKRKSLEC